MPNLSTEASAPLNPTSGDFKGEVANLAERNHACEGEKSSVAATYTLHNEATANALKKKMNVSEGGVQGGLEKKGERFGLTDVVSYCKEKLPMMRQDPAESKKRKGKCSHVEFDRFSFHIFNSIFW